MPDPKPKRLDQVLSASAGRLGAVAAHSRRLADAAQRLADCLPGGLAAHCRLADLDDGRLVVAADSSAWATRLRYHTAELRQKLGVETCRVIVMPVSAPVARGRPPLAPISERAAGVLESTAQSVADPALAAALRRLARNRAR